MLIESQCWYVLDNLFLAWIATEVCSQHPLEDSPATVRVIVYPPHDHGSFIVTADVDKSVPISIISSRIPYRLNQKYEPCEQDPVSDMEGRIYTFIGRIDLDWHKEKVAVGYSETFYVIDSEVPMVLFGKSAFPTTPGRKSNGSCMPIMARKAKPGTYNA